MCDYINAITSHDSAHECNTFFAAGVFSAHAPFDQPEAFGAVGAMFNFVVAFVVDKLIADFILSRQAHPVASRS